MNITAVAPQANSGSATPAVSPRLHQAASQFEAMLLKDMLKPLGKAATEGDNDDGYTDDREAGPLQGFAVDAVAGSIARSGALGFARQIEQTLASSKSKNNHTEVSSPETTRR